MVVYVTFKDLLKDSHESILWFYLYKERNEVKCFGEEIGNPLFL